MSKRTPTRVFAATLVALVAGYVISQSEKDLSTARQPSASIQTIEGTAKANDGDSLTINDQRIRLFGIDAPELAQKCQDLRGKTYACGEKAKQALAQLVAGRVVKCVEQNQDDYGRSVAICKSQNVDLAERLVTQGWALAYRHYSERYVKAEDHARGNKNGIWHGKFQNPYNWRQQHSR